MHQIRIQKLNDEELCKYPGSFRITCGLFLELWSISLAFAAEEFEAKLKVMPDLHLNLERCCVPPQKSKWNDHQNDLKVRLYFKKMLLAQCILEIVVTLAVVTHKC